ncbi:alpha/beta fold hydrolase [Kitasatospora sp. NPDC048365]|uniref:alpha/beta fold hydrolase n=1 Tax=Kitasatospora sp. NPDC048365 TaxID=3364050 RepID=UPI003716EE93
MDILLIGGLWLDGSTAWDAVVSALRELGHRPRPLTLPGQGDGNASATLEDQVAAVVAAVDASAGKPLLVVHSAACSLGWMAADARPEGIADLVMIGGFPYGDGHPYADLFEVRDGAMAFPGWEPFAGPDSADLDEELRERLAADAVPVPEKVARGTVRLNDPARHRVPVTVICPEFTAEQARTWVAAGDVPELAPAEQVEFVDIDSGHWPMFSRPTELAKLLGEVASRA